MNFELAAANIKQITVPVSDGNLLKLYGLYKQSTVGDVNTERPSFWDLTGKAKWDSWKSYEGISEETAKEKYIKLVDELLTI